MKVLLVMPASEPFRVLEGQKPRNRKMLRFSVISLTTVAALTPDKYDVEICDENVEAVDFNTDADVIGISFMTGHAPRAYEISDRFRKLGKKTVAGGYHPTFCTAEALEHFDVVVAGEAENVWAGVLADIELGREKRVYSEPLDDAGNIPVPRRVLLKHSENKYITTNTIQIGRGCMHKCKFCSVTKFFDGKYKARPLGAVIEHLKSLPKIIMIIDDNIIADKQYASELFKAMIPLKKKWVSQCSIEIADDPELLSLAKKSGCMGLFIGIETISEKNLTSVDKGFNKSNTLKQRIRTIQNAGIGVQGGMIVGLDSDDTDAFERTLAFLQEMSIDAIQLSILTPNPGTPLFEEYKNAGRIFDFDWANYDYRNVVFLPHLLTPHQLKQGADWLYHEFYRLDRILMRSFKAALRSGFAMGLFVLQLNLTYNRSNRLLKIEGQNPNANHNSNYNTGFVSQILKKTAAF